MTSDLHQGDVPSEPYREGAVDLRELVLKAHFQASSWLDSMSPRDLERHHVERLHALTEHLLGGEKISLAAMEQLRKQLCECCRRLNAGANHKGCNGRALGHCPILIKLSEK